MTVSNQNSQFRYFAKREDYLTWLADPSCQRLRRDVEAPVAAALVQGKSPRFYCHAHRGPGQLKHAPTALTEAGYYWRESGACSVCGAITRTRMAAEWFHRAAQGMDSPRVYITEQLTPLYKALRPAFAELAGSEYTPDLQARAAATRRLASFLGDQQAAIQHEDVCDLSFADQSLDLIGSFDVLEHVPDYVRALREFRRVLRDGGQLLLTAPFLNASSTTLTRASVDGETIIHYEPPEFHGNPTIPGDGVLCFYHFGWDLLEALRSAGLRSVALLDAWGDGTAVFGDQNAIVATR